MKKILIIAFILLSIAVGGYYFVRQLLRDPAQLVKNLPEIARHLEFELDNVRYGHTRLGVKKWELSTRRAKRIKGQKNILLEGVTARIYAEGKLKGDTRILADTGSYLVDSGDMELQGAVKIENQQFNIATERLIYQAESEKIEAPESVLVESEKLTIKANQATIDLRQQQLHFSGAVRASIRIDKKVVTAKNMEDAKKSERSIKEKVDNKSKPEVHIKKH